MKFKIKSRALAAATYISVLVIAGMLPMLVHADDKHGAGVVTLIVPFGPASGANQLAHESAKLLAGVLPAEIKITNVPGATGNTGIAKLLASPSDGHTMAVLNADTFSLLAYLNPGWKLSDIVPLAVMVKQPSALFLPTNSRFKNWAEFEKEARLKPDTLHVAITGLGSPDYLTLQQLAAKGIKLAPLPLSDAGERFRAVLDGKADALYEQQGDVQELMDANKLKPVLVFSAARVANLKDVPTAQELGLAVANLQFRAFIVKAGTDPAKVKLMSDSLDKVAAMPQYKSFLVKESALADSYVPAKDAVTFMQGELETLKKIVQSLPFHARYIIKEAEFERYVEPF